jgi:ABC-type multidrug transport system fused ATPase/permease subunit
MIKFTKFHLTSIVKLLSECNLSLYKVAIIIVPYYFFTILGALIDSIGLILLVGCFINGFTLNDQTTLPTNIIDILNLYIDGDDTFDLLFFMIILFGLNIVIRFGILVFNGYCFAYIRRELQTIIYKNYIYGNWANLRSFRVGDAVGTITWEVRAIGKYIVSALITIYSLLCALVLGLLALITSFKVTFSLALICLPLLLLVNFAFKKMAFYSKKNAEYRNIFTSDVTDRLNGLLQIHLDVNTDFHAQQGLRAQAPLMRMEVLESITQAGISMFNLLMPFMFLIAFALWLSWFDLATLPNMGIVASIGVLGLKFVTHLNNSVSQVGNLARLSGSIHPVIAATDLPPMRSRSDINSKIIEIQMKNVEYDYDGKKVIKSVSLNVKNNKPLVLNGRSGSGKTTIANLLSGLYLPSKGTVTYIDNNNNKYSSENFKALIGFVTQDIYLFHGTLRENLTSGLNKSDEQIWSVLHKVDADDFVRSLGGLDSKSSEAGRSLSGGQRRRLGIASAILKGTDILIFDEITGGLDYQNKQSVINVISRLSADYIVIMISHEEVSLPEQETININ